MQIPAVIGLRAESDCVKSGPPPYKLAIEYAFMHDIKPLYHPFSEC